MNTVIQVNKEDVQKACQFLTTQGLEQHSVGSGTAFRSKEAVITVYNSGKILIQGKNIDHWDSLLKTNIVTSSFNNQKNLGYLEKPKIIEESSENTNVWPRIGSDESGKGDFFGPLVTASYMITSLEAETVLLNLGVKDSKKLSDAKIVTIASKIKSLGPHKIVKIGPAKYNELYLKFNNLNKILGWSHARAIENILNEHSCNLIVADQFGDESIIQKALFEKGGKTHLIQMHKAERDTAVAAASILARATFVESLQQLGRKLGVTLPLGAGENVLLTAVQIGNEKGISVLNEIVKKHFKTYDKVIKLLK